MNIKHLFNRGPKDDTSLTEQAVIAIVVHTTYQFGASIATIFLNLFLWRLSGDLLVNALYNAIYFFAVLLAFILFGKPAKQKGPLFVYRLGIGLICLVNLSIVLARDMVSEYYYLFAIFAGVSTAAYWLGFFAITMEVTTDRNRIRFLGMSTVFFNIATMIGPVISGFLISRLEGLTGYVFVFALAFAMLFVAAAISLRLKIEMNGRKKYFLNYTPLMLRKYPVYARSQAGWLLLGLFQGVMAFLPNILLFSVIPREDAVSYIGVLSVTLSILVTYWLAKRSKNEMARPLLTDSAVVFVLAVCVVFFELSASTAILFICLYSIGAAIQNNAYNAFYFFISDKMPLKGSLGIETIVMREISVNVGRVIAILIFAASVTGVESPALPWVVGGMAILQLAFYWLIPSREALHGWELAGDTGGLKE